MIKKLRRYPDEAFLGGVCAGLAYSASLPTWIVRLIVALLIYYGDGLPTFLYIILWVILEPRVTPRDYTRRSG